ncbi:MAG: hypothetical protein HY044_00315 [Candidatus Woesebacteria bacterium]|nr:MAG: hypothetical protein HY044_00315 [Candidatus Woesebacteria bacterium]
MKIAIFAPASEFTQEQQEVLRKFGEAVFVENRSELPLQKLIEIAKGAEIIAVDPDPLGGFEKARNVLKKMMESLPKLHAVCLSTTTYGWVDLDYCKKRNITVSNIPGYSRESVAEHTLGLLLGLAKHILVTDRKTQKGKYQLEMGFELKGKTLGIIGLGSIGSRVAELGQGIGMKVIAYNPSPRSQNGVEMKTFDEVLHGSDAITLHLKDSPELKNMIGKKELEKMKDGVVIVNTVDRELIDEQAMANAIKSGKVYGYAYEAEDLENTQLAEVDNAIGIKGFGWYTKEALSNLFVIWVENISGAVAGKPQNTV